MSESCNENGGSADDPRELGGGRNDFPLPPTQSFDENQETAGFKTKLPPFDMDMDMSLPFLNGSPMAERDFPGNDPYIDDDLLRDDPAGDYFHSGPQAQAADTIRSVYKRGAHSTLKQRSHEGVPYLESGSFSGVVGDGSYDHSVSHQEMHTPSHPRGSPHPAGGFLGEEQDEEGLYIESMSGFGAGDSMGGRMYQSSSLGSSMMDSLRDPGMYRNHSPRPFDGQPPRRRSFIHDEGRYNTPDLHRGGATQSYNSLSVFRDGGVGIGSRGYLHGGLGAPLGDEQEWNRSRSLSRNMDMLGGYSHAQYPARSSYAALRSGSVPHAPPGLEPGLGDYGDSYGGVREMGGFSGRMAPHRVTSMERLPNDYLLSRDYYGSRSGLPYNRSYVDSLGGLDRDSDLPMSRARSMMYLGDEGEFEAPPSYSFAPLGSGEGLRGSRHHSMTDLSAMGTLPRSYTTGELEPAVTADYPRERGVGRSPGVLAMSGVVGSAGTSDLPTSKSGVFSPTGAAGLPHAPTSPLLRGKTLPAVSLTGSAPAPAAGAAGAGAGAGAASTPALSSTVASTSPSTPTLSASASLVSTASTGSAQPPNPAPASGSAPAGEGEPGHASPLPEWRQRPSASPHPQGSERHRPTAERGRSPHGTHGGHGGHGEEEGERKNHGKYRFPCRDFEKGVCSRGAACKFYHDPAKAVTTPDKIPVCRDFSKGKCTRDNCRFRHPGTHKDNVLMGLEEPASQEEYEMIMKQFSSTLKPRQH